MKILINAIHEYFTSTEGKRVLGEAINFALEREMEFEQARDDNGNPIVPPKRKTQNVNVVDQLVIYLSRTEGAWRGVQNDLNTREGEIRALVAEFKEEQKRVAAAFKFLGGAIEQLAIAQSSDKPQIEEGVLIE